DRGRLLLRRELVRQRPARGARDEAHRALLVVAVELVDHAVDVVRQRIAAFADPRVVGEQAVDAAGDADLAADREAELVQPGQRLRMGRRQLRALDLAQRVRVERERALRGDPRVELAQGAGGPVAWIGHRLVAAGARGLVPALERGLGHHHFATHLQHLRRLAAQAQRNRTDGAQVGADVLAAGTVAAGGAAHEAAVLVAQADREAVELGLHRESGIGVAGLLL